MGRLFCICLGICWLIASAAGHAKADTVLVLSQSAAKLSAIDPRTQRVTASLQLDRAPANMVVSPDQTLAYIAHSDLGKISVVDLKDWRVDRTYAVPGSPFGLSVSSSGQLYVGDWNGDQIHRLDAKTGKVLNSARSGKAPAHLVLSPDGASLFVTARESDTVTRFRSDDLQETASISVGKAPFAIAVSADAQLAVVANVQGGSVSLIDLKQNKISKTIQVGGLPYGVVFLDGGRRVLVTNQQEKSISTIDLEAVTAPVRTQVGEYPEGIAASVEEGQVYVANWFSDDLSIIDTRGETPQLTAQVKVPGGPRAVAVIRDGVRSP